MLIAMAHKEKCLKKALLKKATLAISGDAEIPHLKDGPRQVQLTIQVAESGLLGELSRLHDLERVDDKIALKKSELIPKYLPVTMQAIDSGANYHSELFFYVALWLIDAGMIEEALPVCDFVVQHHMPVPPRFKRDAATLFADGIWTWAEDLYKLGQSAEPYFSQVLDYAENQQWIVRDIVHGQLCKLAALFAELTGDHESEVKWYTRCTEVNPEGHGVKTKLNAAIKKCAK